MILVKFKYLGNIYQFYFSDNFLDYYSASPNKNNKKAILKICHDVSLGLLKLIHFESSYIHIIHAMTSPKEKVQGVVTVLCYSVDAKIWRERILDIQALDPLVGEESIDINDGINYDESSLGVEYSKIKNLYLKQCIANSEKNFLQHCAHLSPMPKKPVFLLKNSLFDYKNALSVFGLSSNIEHQLNSIIRDQLFTLKKIHTDFDHLQNNFFNLFKLDNQWIELSTEEDVLKIREQYLSKLSLDQIKKQIDQEKIYAENDQFELIVALLKSKYQEYINATSYLRFIKNNIAWFIYKSAHDYYKKLKKQSEITLNKLETFNKKFQTVGISLSSIGQLSSIDGIYSLFENCSLSVIQEKIRELLIQSDTTYFFNSSAQDCIRNCLYEFQDYLKKELNVNNDFFSFPLLINNKTDFTWNEFVLNEESKIVEKVKVIKHDFFISCMGDGYFSKNSGDIETNSSLDDLYLNHKKNIFQLAVNHILHGIDLIKQKFEQIKKNIIHDKHEIFLKKMKLKMGDMLKEQEINNNELLSIDKEIEKLALSVQENNNFSSQFKNKIVNLRLSFIKDFYKKAIIKHDKNIKLNDQYKLSINLNEKEYQNDFNVFKLNNVFIKQAVYHGNLILQEVIESIDKEKIMLQKKHHQRGEKTNVENNENNTPFLKECHKEATVLSQVVNTIFVKKEERFSKEIIKYLNENISLLSKQISFWGGGVKVVYGDKTYKLPKGVAEIVKSINEFNQVQDYHKLWGEIVQAANRAESRTQACCTRYSLFHVRGKETTNFYNKILNLDVEDEILLKQNSNCN